MGLPGAHVAIPSPLIETHRLLFCGIEVRDERRRSPGFDTGESLPGLPGSMWGNLRWGGIAHRVPYLRDCLALTTPAPVPPLSSILLSKLDSRGIVGESVSRKSSAWRRAFSFEPGGVGFGRRLFYPAATDFLRSIASLCRVMAQGVWRLQSRSQGPPAIGRLLLAYRPKPNASLREPRRSRT